MTHIESTDGRVFEIDYDTAWFDPTVPWTYDIQFRCKICPDAIGEAADVSCPDGWVMEDGKPIHREAPGVNVVLPRTAAGRRLVAEAAAAGDIHLEPFTLAELDLMHADHYQRKLENPGRLLGLVIGRRAAAADPALPPAGHAAARRPRPHLARVPRHLPPAPPRRQSGAFDVAPYPARTASAGNLQSFRSPCPAASGTFRTCFYRESTGIFVSFRVMVGEGDHPTSLPATCCCILSTSACGRWDELQDSACAEQTRGCRPSPTMTR